MVDGGGFSMGMFRRRDNNDGNLKDFSKNKIKCKTKI
jgi:hypothetical protein